MLGGRFFPVLLDHRSLFIGKIDSVGLSNWVDTITCALKIFELSNNMRGVIVDNVASGCRGSDNSSSQKRKYYKASGKGVEHHVVPKEGVEGMHVDKT